MVASLSAKELERNTNAYVDLFGEFRSQGHAKVYDRSPIMTVTIALRMANRPGEARISYDTSDKIAGLYLLRAGVPIPTASR